MKHDAIRDKVAIVGMGCCKFGENWDKDPQDMIVEAAYEAYADAGIEDPQQQIEAVFCGAQYPSKGTAEVADALKLYDRPVSMVRQLLRHRHRRVPLRRVRGRVRHVRHRAGGRLRQAEGSRRVGPERRRRPACAACRPRPPAGSRSAPRSTSRPTAPAARTSRSIAVKNHHNGTLAPKSMLKREITVDDVLKARIISWPFGLYDCAAQSDGAAAAIITRRELAKSFRDDFVLVRGIGIALSAEPAGGSELRLPALEGDRDGREAGLRAGRHHRTRGRRSTSRRCTTASR